MNMSYNTENRTLTILLEQAYLYKICHINAKVVVNIFYKEWSFGGATGNPTALNIFVALQRAIDVLHYHVILENTASGFLHVCNVS